jgi:hypothetical protein
MSSFCQPDVQEFIHDPAVALNGHTFTRNQELAWLCSLRPSASPS